MKTKNLVLSALIAAMIFVTTAFVKIPLAVTGYVHLGDAFIFLACVYLPIPFAVVAAGVGSALADVVNGFVLYAPVTLVVKSVMALLFSLCFSKRKNWLNVVGAVAATVFMTLGYFAYEAALYGWTVSATNIPFNLIQGAVCAVTALPVAYATKKQWCVNNVKFSCKCKRK
ncbi:MAG: ECF transporter S component [Corallococcus sp.]|nr:ECF transporter S component [Corallococcus sp.]MCM1360082.1 ECF transporter S component [Corallococcus sp.]MCM1395639.1 ECF transporter S component [Corallococcus sp.]